MSKKLKRFFAGLLAFVMVLAMTAAAAPAKEVKADEEEYFMFLALGGDTEGQSWNVGYYGADTDNVTGTTAMVSEGETVTVGITCATPITTMWFNRPIIVAEGIENIEYTIDKVTVDGVDITSTIDLAAGAAFWYEATGDFGNSEALCLAGGYNEWGTKYIATAPSNFKEIMYTITVTKIEKKPEYFMFLALGGDTEGQSWNVGYYGADTENVTGTTAMVSEGETVTVGINCATPITTMWFNRPIIVAPNVENIEYTIDKVTVDGVDITSTIDLAAGAAWWYEATGDFGNSEALCLAGGYNEWGTKYLPTAPSNFQEIMYTITITKIEKAPEYFAFVAVGGDTEGQSWNVGYYGADTENVTGTTAMVSEGETVTIGFTCATPITTMWFNRPVIVAEGIGILDYTIDKITVDGVDITSTVDLTAGDAWWYEATGDFGNTEALCLAGGYNEWGTKYIATAPTNFKEMMYTITINKISTEAALDFGTEVGTPYTGEFQMFLAMQGDQNSDNDWMYTWANGSTDTAGVTGNVVTAKVGDTVTLSLNFPTPIFHTWWLAPCMVVDTEVQQDIAWVSYTIDSLKIDGVDVTDTIDYSQATKAWGYEGSGDWPVTKTIRLSGGYNEWADKVIASPSGCTSIEYTITITGLNEGASLLVEEKPSVDKNGTYHAYMGIQTDMWEFRNAWDDASYGLESLEYPEAFGQFSLVDSVEGLVKKDGTFTDVEIAGNGSYSLKFEGFNLLEGTTRLNLLFISTDIPNSGEITISNVKAYFDGKEILSFADGIVDGDSKDWLKVLCANLWNNALEGSYSIADMVPKSTVEITFDVSGFDYDKAGSEPVADPTEAPAEPTKAPTEPTQAPSQGTDETPASSGGMNPVVIVVIVVVVVAAAGVAVVLLKKKK